MAKAYLVQASRRGSVGQEVFSVLRGTTIVRSKASSVLNPKTYAQMNQRSKFINAVRFYQHSQKAFFKMAFEDKRKQESDYNAFMRHNTSLAPNITPDMSNSFQFPALGNWQVCAGSLGALDFSYQSSLNCWVLENSKKMGDDWLKMGELSATILASYPNLQVGDIITFVQIKSALESIASTDLSCTYYDAVTAPTWSIKQFILDPESEVLLSDFFSGWSYTWGEGSAIGLRFQNITEVIAPKIACGMIAVASRNTSSGLKVTNSSVQPNTTAQTAITLLQTSDAIQKTLNAWGAKSGAILQGSLA